MRVSTNMIFESNVSALNDKSSTLLKINQQVSSGKRILTPSDDPVAASQVLELSQSAAVNNQYLSAQGSAKSTLGLIDGQLSSVTDILSRVRELGVQAGNAALSTSDRKAISTELRSRFEELVGIANSTDGTGQYLYSGYQGSNQPFTGSVENGVTYSGDDGQRSLRVSASRLMPVSVTGSDLFTNVKNGNGVFVTAPQTSPINGGSGIIDAGSVSDLSKWNNTANVAQIEIRFWQDPVTAARYYDLVDAGGNSMYTGTASSAGGATNTFTHAYSAGSAITLSGLAAPYTDLGASVTISGTPNAGDVFTINHSSSSGMFTMMKDLITAVETPATLSSGGNAQMQNDLGAAMSSLSMVEDNILRVRADVGSRLGQLDDLTSMSQGLDIQYQSRVSDLQNVDYNKAITDLTRYQTQLQATQQSFVKISGLSLFNYLP